MKKNTRFYYKPNNFITVSGMLYRMKQNAVGLASICLLSTAVLVTLSSCLSLFYGGADAIKLQYPREVTISCYLQNRQNQQKDIQTFTNILDDQSQKFEIPFLDPIGFTTVSHTFYYSNGKFSSQKMEGWQNIYVCCYVQKDYNQIASEPLSLQDDEIAILSPGGTLFDETITLNGTTYHTQTITTPAIMDGGNDIGFIFPATEDLWELTDSVSQQTGDFRTVKYQYFFNVPDDSQNIDECLESIWSTHQNDLNFTYWTTQSDAQLSFYRTFGSLLFIGIFFVTVFLTATVLIIYYKQVTEGYDDHERFQIMQKVGMSDREIKRAIQKQILTVFFLPLIVAIIHVFVALPVLTIILTTLGLLNSSVFLFCVLMTIGVFAVFYFIVYQLTAKTYYRIIKTK